MWSDLLWAVRTAGFWKYRGEGRKLSLSSFHKSAAKKKDHVEAFPPTSPSVSSWLQPAVTSRSFSSNLGLKCEDQTVIISVVGIGGGRTEVKRKWECPEAGSRSFPLAGVIMAGLVCVCVYVWFCRQDFISLTVLPPDCSSLPPPTYLPSNNLPPPTNKHIRPDD